MAVQLYGEGYALSCWKARHILWWSAIEALYGSNEDAAMARIYAFFGNKSFLNGYNCPIYEKGDTPNLLLRLTRQPSHSRENGAADLRGTQCLRSRSEGFRLTFCPDSASAWSGRSWPRRSRRSCNLYTFIIRKTVIEVLKRGWQDKFKDRNSRDDFWLLTISGSTNTASTGSRAGND